MLFFLNLKVLSKKTILFGVMFFFSLTLSAQEWKYLLSDDGSDFYVQAETSQNSFHSKLWVKETAPKIEYEKNEKKQILYNGFVVRLMVFDCSDREYNLERVVYYSSNGKVIYTESFEMNGILVSPWEKAIPGTLGDKFVLYMCGGGSPNKY
jgi:hypothetical protein